MLLYKIGVHLQVPLLRYNTQSNIYGRDRGLVVFLFFF